MACGSYQCGTLQVPIDPARPAGRKIGIALERAQATDSKHRLGSLLINPGGPGESTLSEFGGLVGILSKNLRSRFDVVGFDPRGIGGSDPIRCLTDQQTAAFIDVDPAPTTAAGVTATEAAARGVATACRQRGGPLLPYIGTADVAADMDRIRAAVGDPKLTYLGFSYGTYLGSVYAQRYPTRVRALALDGAVDPTTPPLRAAVEQAAGFQHALGAFLSDCASSGDCAWSPGGNLTAAYRRLIDGLRTHPVPASDGRTLGAGEAFLGVAAALYDRASGWPLLARGLARLQQGDGSILLALSDSYVGRQSDGRYTNLTDSSIAIQCVDRPFPRDTAAYQQAATTAERSSPDFGEAVVLGNLPCASWPVPATGTTAPVHAPGAPAVLVVGSTGDPATPYAQAVSLAKQFLRGALLTRVGEGHTGYDASACVQQRVDAYLVDLRVPSGAQARCDP